MSAGDPPGDGAQPTCCAHCGTAAVQRPLTWSSESDGRGTRWLCDACTREHLRAIEGRLDEAWW